MINTFTSEPTKDTLDLSNFSSSNLRDNILPIIQRVTEARTIPKLKLARVCLSDEQLYSILAYLDQTEFLNLSFNNLTEASLTIILDYFQAKLESSARPRLTTIKMDHNRIAENSKLVKDRIGEIKKLYGVDI